MRTMNEALSDYINSVVTTDRMAREVLDILERRWGNLSDEQPNVLDFDTPFFVDDDEVAE
jgi:hypothetical protein